MSKTIKIPGRLESAETGNVVAGANAILDDTKGKKQNVINEETDAELLRLDQEKQGNLIFDQTPTENSTNPVTSGGVYAADQKLSQAIEAILLLIPSAASEINKLVDLATMNSSISTATASFKGTYNLVSDLHLTVSATHAQIAAALDALSLGADNNDYAFVQVPNTDTAPMDIAKTERYKFNGENWAYEYDLNNSGFTTAQWNAINSGITTLLVAKLSALPTNEALTLALAGKQDNLTFDNAPTAGSNNPVKSGGIYTRNNEIVALINALDVAKQNVLTFDTTPINGSTNPVTSNGVYLAIQLVQTAVVALDGRMGTAETKISTAEGNIVNLQAAYAALTQSALVVIAPTDTWPVASPAQNTIYRVVDRANTPPLYYSDYMWNGTTMVPMAQYDNAIDDVPTFGSNNLVKSGGVFDSLLLKTDKEDTDALIKVYKKQIVPRTSSSTVIDADTNGKMAANIPAKQYYDILLKDPQNSISSVGAVYAIYHGSSSRTNLGITLVPNVKKRLYTTQQIDYICIFVARASMNPDTAIVELCVYDEHNAIYDIAQNQNSIGSIEDDILHKMVHIEQPNTLNLEKFVSYSKNEGEMLKVKVVDNNNTLTRVNLYVLYEGESSHTTIAGLTSSNSFKYEGVLAKNITRVDFFIDKSWTTGSVNCDLVIESAIKEELSICKAIIADNTEKIEVINRELYAKWEDEIAATAGSEISPNLTKQAVDIKAGDKFSIEVIDDDESLTDNAVKGLYAFYVSNPTAQVNLMYDAVTNTEYEFTAPDNIAYIGIWVQQGIVIRDTTLIVTVGGYGLIKKVEDLENKSLDAFNQDANDALKRFIPISSTTPDDDIRQLSDSALKENVNLLFMTDSHIDYLAATESMENVMNTVGFANRCKRVIQLVNSRLNNNLFDAVIHTGDILTSSHADKNITLGYARSFFNVTQELESPLLFAPGNHDRNDSNQVPSNVITDEDWMTLYGDYAEQNYGIVRQVKANGKKSPWFYYDIADKKVRVISVYINDVDYSVTNEGGKVLYNESNGWYIAQEQMSWLINTALDFDDKDEKDWGVVVIIHQSMRITSSLENKPWYSTGSAITNPAYQFESSIQKFFEVCKAFNTQGTYSNSYSFATDSFFDLTISADFTRYANLAKKPHMICWLNGHEHIDYNMVKDGINIIWTAQHSAMNAFSDMRVPRLIGTSTQNLFDLISIDTTHRKIKIVRVGAGVNCYGGGLLYGDRFMPNGISY